jgi:hypothetical protein
LISCVLGAVLYTWPMSSEAAPLDLLFDLPEPPAGRKFINDRLWFVDHDGLRIVFLSGIVLYRFLLDDVLTRRFVAVSLRLDKHATQIEIAAAFGHGIRSQARWERLYRQHSVEGLQDGKSTGRPRALDDTKRAILLRWFEIGLSNREMARRFGVDESCVRRELSRLGLERPATGSLLEDEEEPAESEDTAAADEDLGEEPKGRPAPFVPGGTGDVDPLNRCVDRELARRGLIDDASPFFAWAESLPRAGALLAIPLLVRSGALGVFERIYGSLGPAFYGLRSTVVCLFLLALLRIKRAEGLKEHSPRALGRIMGLDRMPEVKTLRRKLWRLAKAEKGEELMRALAELRITQDRKRVGYLYVDGHVREYHGKHPLGKAHVTSKRISAPASTDTWVNDAEGGPLFTVTSELNAGLTKMLPIVLEEVRTFVGKERPVTVVFDRGGYSPRLFAKLVDAGFHLITYRKGERDEVAREEFEEVRVKTAKGVETWEIHDKAEVPVGVKRAATKTREAEPWLVMRQVSRIKKDGEGMTQVLATRRDLEAVELLARMFSRWRQENYFKYMDAEFALDALCEYGAEELSDEADRPNPTRREMEKRRAKLKARLSKRLATLGEEVEENEESRRKTVRGLKIANAELRQEIAVLTEGIEDLTSRIRSLPPRVNADDLRRLPRQRRLVVDSVKMLAYQVETDLHRMLFGRYARADDEGRTLLHSIFQAPARLEPRDKELLVTIERLSQDHKTKVLRELCDEVNELEVNFPGSDLRLVLAVEPPEAVPERATNLEV